MNRDGIQHASLEGLARFLLRAELVASSRIEGLHAGPRRLVEAEAQLAYGDTATDRIAAEVIGNITAMDSAVDLATNDTELVLDRLLEIHHIGGLTAFRHIGAPTSAERSAAAHEWLRTFAAATRRACNEAHTYAARIDALVEAWRTELGSIRRGSALDLLIGVLPGAPLITVASAAALVQRSEVATSAAVNRLVDAGILVQRNIGKQRYRVFEAPSILDLFTTLERALASPTGDTATSGPVRSVPQPPT